MTTFALANAPLAVSKLYGRALDEQLDAGKPRDAAEKYALRQVQHAGWYKATKGWKQLYPDVRDKVNVREAIQQPDGRYAIYDVDVFYPNAAKGLSLLFSAERIAKAIQNTNRAIAAGGQKPALLEGHPNPLQAAIGTQLDAHGFAVNWRSSPRGSGWARCDLIDVRPETVSRMRDLKLTGLSAGFAQDAHGLNERFGHVAMLGGTTQQLSHLPVTEIFSSPHQVCFSAQTPTDAFQGVIMPLNDKQKAAFSALSAAYASFAAGEPGCEDKLKEARAMYESEMGQAAPELSTANAGGTETGAGGTDVPAFNSDGTINFAADPEGAFNALTKQVSDLTGLAGRQNETIKSQKLVIAGLVGKGARAEFDAEIATLKREGHHLPADDQIAAMFDTCFSASDPKKALATYLGNLKSLPKRESLAGVGTVFGTDGAAAANGGSAAAKAAEIDLHSIASDLGADFSADDMKLGASILKAVAGAKR